MPKSERRSTAHTMRARLAAVAKIAAAVLVALATSTATAQITTITVPQEPVCGQPLSTGSGPLASDCLFILKAAVGVETCDPEWCQCDLNADLSISATDALTCLNAAVGADVELRCPCAAFVTACCVAPLCAPFWTPTQCQEAFGDLGAVDLGLPLFDNMGLPYCSDEQNEACAALGPTTTTLPVPTTTTTTTLPPPTGPCCPPLGGACTITTESGCVRGTYLGDAEGDECSEAAIKICADGGPTTTTTTVPAEPIGICCTPPQSCSIETTATCEGLGGTYLSEVEQGRDRQCSSGELASCIEFLPPTTTTTTTTTTTLPPVFGACCADGVCSIVEKSQCAGEYLGDSSGRGCTLAQIQNCN